MLEDPAPQRHRRERIEGGEKDVEKLGERLQNVKVVSSSSSCSDDTSGSFCIGSKVSSANGLSGVNKDDSKKQAITPKGTYGGHRHGQHKKKLEIPENWIDVPKIGVILQGTRFVAMRVPLADAYTPLLVHQGLDNERWTPQVFLQYEQQDPQLDIGMVIDLTNTFKYYDGQQAFKDSKVRYVKLKVEGFKAPPKENDIQKFMNYVDEFFATNRTGQVAVHCTHGLNRTGYLIVQYLVRRMNWPVSKALQAFNDARPPGLIKYMYIDDLFQALGQQDERPVYPELPEWAQVKYSKRRF